MSTRKETAGSSSIVTLGILALGAFILVWFVMPTGIDQDIEARCKVDGLGEGSCTFTNTGWTPGTVCVDVKITNTDGRSISSGTICSGRVWPNDTVEKAVAINLGDHCTDKTSRSRASFDICQLDIELK